MVKAYPEAQNHLLIGEVLAKDRVCVELCCRSFHFGRVVNGMKDVRGGEMGVRIIPWSRIEVINVLPSEFMFGEAELRMDNEGGIRLEDGKSTCRILTSREPRH